MSLRLMSFLLWLLVAMPPALGEQALIADLLSMPASQIESLPAFSCRAMITALGEGIATSSSNLGSIVVEDDSGAMWVSINRAERQKILETNRGAINQLEIGMVVEIQGHVAPGGFAPVMLPATISIVERSKLPTAPTANLERFIRGGDYLRTVTAQGVVQNIVEEQGYGWLLQVETGLGYFLCRVPQRQPYLVEKLLDAEVLITGVAAVSRNWRREYVCPRLIIASDADFEILQAPLPDPFQAQAVELSQLNVYSPAGTPLHRIRVKGVVTYADNAGSVFVQEDDFAVRIETLEAPSLVPGDFVVASGFVDTSEHVAGLAGAVVRVDGKHPVPPPLAISFSKILEDNQELLSGNRTEVPGYDGIYAELSGTVLSHNFEIARARNMIELDCGDSVSTVFVMGNAKPHAPGSRIRARGVVRFKYEGPRRAA